MNINHRMSLQNALLKADLEAAENRNKIQREHLNKVMEANEYLQNSLQASKKIQETQRQTIECLKRKLEHKDEAIRSFLSQLQEPIVKRKREDKIFQIFIRAQNYIAIYVKNDTTIGQVKLELKERTGIDLSRIRLTYEGKFLDSNESVMSYNIGPESTLYVRAFHH